MKSTTTSMSAFSKYDAFFLRLACNQLEILRIDINRCLHRHHSWLCLKKKKKAACRPEFRSKGKSRVVTLICRRDLVQAEAFNNNNNNNNNKNATDQLTISI